MQDGPRNDDDLTAGPGSGAGGAAAGPVREAATTQPRGEEHLPVGARALLELALQGGDIGLYNAELPDGRVHVDARYLEMLGYRPGEIRLDVDTWRSLVHPDDLPRVEGHTAEILVPGHDRFDAEYRMRHRDGRWVWVLDRARVYQRDADGRVVRTAGTHVDVTRRKHFEARIEYLAEHDELTGLLNRRGIWRAVERIHAQSERAHCGHCLAMLDLDHFKQINDAYGHAAGDAVLRAVAGRIRRELRGADWLGRWGGEEFLVCLPNTSAAQGLTTVERLRLAVSAAPIQLRGQQVRLTLSAGLAACEPGASGPPDILARADAALYRAKAEGRDRVCYAGGSDGDQTQSLAALVQAAARGTGILAAFQPIVDLHPREGSAAPAGYPVVAEQCLARLADSGGRVLPAAAFLDIARELGVLHRVDEVLFQAALGRLHATLRERRKAMLRFVHLSADLLRHQHSIEAMSVALADLPGAGTADGLPLVVTLSAGQVAAMTDTLADAIAPLLGQGCRLAVADVGGDASFRLLAELPARYLQIAPTLVHRLPESARVRTIVGGIARIAAELDVVTIARPVEASVTCDLLRSLGVHWGQGRLFAPPSEPMADRLTGHRDQ
jgi:diguanylate cyclase (GGDEF)-like protein/PAS domain S-box-containing protein